MYQEIDRDDFIQAFEDRRPNNFSRDGLVKLYDYLWEIEEATGEKIELDVIGLCCDYVEFDVDAINISYNQGFETLDEAVGWLESETIIAGVTDSTVVFVQF